MKPSPEFQYLYEPDSHHVQLSALDLPQVLVGGIVYLRGAVFM